MKNSVVMGQLCRRGLCQLCRYFELGARDIPIRSLRGQGGEGQQYGCKQVFHRIRR